jgi:hypothetical protein
VHYYRALALMVLGRPREAAEALARFSAEQPRGRWATRVEAHLVALGKGSEGSKQHFRVTAAGTAHADETLPAPSVDATLHGHPGLFEPCLDQIPAAVHETTRIAVDVDFDEGGTVQRARILGREEWVPFASCVEARLKSGLRVPRPPGARPASARVELLLSPRR